MKRKQTNWDVLKQKREGFVMINDANNIEIKCTPEFKQLWINRGFRVKEKKVLALV